MSDKLREINVTLSYNQKIKLNEAFRNREPITLRLKNDALSGSDTLLVPSTIVEKLEKNRTMNKGMEIKLAETYTSFPFIISFLDSIMSLDPNLDPALATKSEMNL